MSAEARPFSFKPFANQPEYDEFNQKAVETTMKEAETPPERLVIMEIGCSVGNVTRIIQEKYEAAGIHAIIVGLDINGQALAEAQKDVPSSEKVQVVFLHADATQIPLKSNSIDIIYVPGVVHEVQGVDETTGIEKKDMLLSEITRVAKPGAIVYIISGFTAEMFAFEKIQEDGTVKRITDRAEFLRFGIIRKESFSKLGRKKDPEKSPFEVLSTHNICNKLKEAGLVIDEEKDVKMWKIVFTIKAVRAIGEDDKYLEGMFQDMEGTDTISLEEKRKVYHQVIDEMEEAHRRQTGDPNAELLFKRNFVLFRARKPE